MSTCGWTIDTTCCPDWATYSPAVQAAATSQAVNLLDRLTAYQFGQCPITVRPCNSRCQGFTGYMTWPVGQPGSNGSGMPWMIPFVDNGIWRNCGCTGGCSCNARCEIDMTGPVAAIVEITIDGVILDPSAYRLDRVPGRGAVLVRTDGDCWPECQDMNVDSGEVGSFTVEYRPGRALPADAPLYVGMLACEFAKACSGGGDCALPQQLQSLSRDGVDLQVVDPSILPEAILTGIAAVDRFVRSVNPSNLRQRARVLSPDLRPQRIVT